MQLLHHGTEAGWDWVDIMVILVIVAALAGLGFLIWKIMQRRMA